MKKKRIRGAKELVYKPMFRSRVEKDRKKYDRNRIREEDRSISRK